MRKLMLTFLILGMGILSAAEFKISKELEKDELTVIRNNQRDSDGSFCARIQINSDITGMEFDSNRTPVKIEKEKGRYYVYLSPGERYLIFREDGFAELEYEFPLTLRANTAYNMTVVRSGYGSADEGLVTITFEFNEKDVYIAKGDNPPILTRQRSAQYRLMPGEYSFRFIKMGYEEQERSLMVTEDEIVEIDLEKGESVSKLQLPGIVIINSKPDRAEVYLNDQKVGITPWQDDLIAGSYKLTLKVNMHHSIDQEFTLAEGQTLELPLIELLPKYGFWQVESPYTETELYLNGVFIGKGNLKKQRIESGSHLLTAKLDKYHDLEQEFTVNDGDDKKLEIELKPAFGQLEINSTPVDKAEVYINDEYVGLTPYRDNEKLSGQYRLRIEKEMYAGSEETITVIDEELTQKTLLLNSNFGTLNVTAKKSDIYINGIKVGADRYDANLETGSYTIEARRDRHHSDEKELYLRVGAEEDVDLEPEPIQGSVTVMSEPADSKGAVIWVNGEKEKKTTPAVLPLLIGDYSIRLTHSKYLEQTKNISISEGKQEKLIFEMKTYEGSLLAKRNIWRRNGWLGAVLTAVAVGAGVFFNEEGDSYAEDYANATDSSNAKDSWDKMDSSYQTRDLCYYVSVVPIVYTVYSWIKSGKYPISKYQN